MLPTQPPRANRLLCALTWPGIASCPPCPMLHVPWPVPISIAFREAISIRLRASEGTEKDGERERERETETENRNAQRFFNCHVLRVVAGACGVTSPCLAVPCRKMRNHNSAEGPSRQQDARTTGRRQCQWLIMKCLISPGTKSATESAGRGRDTCHHVAIHVDAAAAFFFGKRTFRFWQEEERSRAGRES